MCKNSRRYNVQIQGVCMTLALWISIVSAVTSESEVSRGIIPSQVKHLGTVDGKSFFIDDTVSLTWAEARSFCVSRNMELPSIQTEAQTEMLVKAITNLGHSIDTRAWTSGRFHPPVSDFIWADTRQRPDEAALTNWAGEMDNYRCLRLYVSTAGRHDYKSFDCALKLFPLCAAKCS